MDFLDGASLSLADAVDALDDVFYVLDGRGDLVHANAHAARVTGYDHEELRAMDLVELFAPEDRQRVREDIRAALETGEATLEADLVTRDGERIPFEFRKRRVDAGDDGAVALVGVGRDVTERERRERALEGLARSTREFVSAGAEERIAEIAVDTVADILGLPHTGIHLREAGRDALEPVAWTETVEETIGVPPTLGPDSLAWAAFEAGEVRRYDDLDGVDGRHDEETPLRSELIVPLGEHGVAIVASTERAAFGADDQRLVRIVCANATVALDRADRERTLRRRERELQRENQRLEEFASLVSHDLRNPLNVAEGRVEIAREERDSDHLEEAAGALERMGTIIDDMLTLAREGKRVEDVEDVDVGALVERCWTNVATGDATLRAEDPPTVRADESRLAQVFENLFRNAVEHGGEGVTITVGALEDGFYVEDDGPGIPPEERDAVFDPGYSTESEGTGFGLSIVREVVDAHGWSVEATEGTAGGARFEVTGVDLA